MVKFHKEWPQIHTALDRLVGFLNRAEELSRSSLPQELAEEGAVVKALEQLDRIGASPEERAIYEAEVNKLQSRVEPDASIVKSAIRFGLPLRAEMSPRLSIVFALRGRPAGQFAKSSAALEEWLRHKGRLRRRGKLPTIRPPGLFSDLWQLPLIARGMHYSRWTNPRLELNKRMVDAVQLREAERRGEERGEIRGEVRGEERGKAEGIQLGLQHVVELQMERRLGVLPEQIVARLHTLSAEDLEDLTVNLLDMASYANVEEWMARR